MNIREFRNNFCKIAEGNKVVTVTKRNEVIGVYTPRLNKYGKCERIKFNNIPCSNVAEKNVSVSYLGKNIKASLCSKCLDELKDNLMEEISLEEL